MWTGAFSDQPVGDLVSTAVELAVGPALSLVVDRHSFGANSSVVARDVSDGQDVGEACAVVHAVLPKEFLVAAATLRAALV